MSIRKRAAVLFCAVAVWAGSPRVGAHTDLAGGTDAAALHELLEGDRGRRESWATAPSLVVVSSVMDYGAGSLATGFPAVDERLTDDDIAGLAADFRLALGELTAGRVAFRSVEIEQVESGRTVKMFRPGQIVVGRFRGVRAATGNLGYGGRATRDGTITGAVVMLDAVGDRQNRQRELIRMHELGHALGFNHVVSRPSIMNPRVGSSITEFDRAAMRQAAFPPAVLN